MRLFMDERNYQHSYENGSTKPPKNRGGIIAVVLCTVIFLCGILSALGIVNKEGLKAYRRHAVCAVVILAALITPSGDPFSLMICTVPLYLLYEFSSLICRSGSEVDVEEEI